MTKYETVATVVSIIAVSLSVLIPLIQWAWRKWIMKSKVTFIPLEQATLFFNQSGSYIRFNGVIESEKKATTIRNLKLVLTRKRDDQKLNLVWQLLISPINQSLLGNYVQTTEQAHPFRVEADSIACAFIEYSDPSDSSGAKIRRICSDLVPLIQQVVPGHTYDEALSLYSKSSEYLEAKNLFLNELFWEIGKYNVDIMIEYGKKNTICYSYEFSITEQDYLNLRENVDETLIAGLKACYQKALSMKAPVVEIRESYK